MFMKFFLKINVIYCRGKGIVEEYRLWFKIGKNMNFWLNYYNMCWWLVICVNVFECFCLKDIKNFVKILINRIVLLREVFNMYKES